MSIARAERSPWVHAGYCSPGFWLFFLLFKNCFFACFIFCVVLFMFCYHSGPSPWNGVSSRWAFTITVNLIMKNHFEAYTQPTLLSRLSFPETLSTQVTIGCIKLTFRLTTAASNTVILDNFLLRMEADLQILASSDLWEVKQDLFGSH